MRWLEKYVGIEWGDPPSRMKCWDLVKAVYKEQLGIELKDYKGVDTSDVADMLRSAREMKRDYQLPPWTQVTEPRDFDVVVMHGHILREEQTKIVRVPLHAGIYIGGRLLHIQDGTNSVWVSLGHPSVSRRIVAFCRHEQMLNERANTNAHN